jgi:hypothetical protein
VAGDRQAVVGDDVGGREAELAAPLVTLDDGALDHEGCPEAAPRSLHVAGRDQRPDPGRGDGLAVDLDQRHHPGLELQVRFQHRRVAFGFGAEAEVLADRHLLGIELLQQDVADEVLRGLLRDLFVEGDDHQLAHPEPLDDVALDAKGHDQLRQRRRV